MPYFLPVAVQILQKMMFLTAHRPDRAVSLQTVWTGSSDVCMVLSIADLGAAGFDFHFSCGISCSIKKKKQNNNQVIKLCLTGLEK